MKHNITTRKMKNIFSIQYIALLGLAAFTSACDDEPTVQRAKVLQVYGGEEVYVGDTQEYTMGSYSNRETFTWAVAGTGASVTSGTGEYLNVAFNQPGSFSIKVTKADGAEGTLNVEAISKTLALEGDTATIIETDEIDTVGIPLVIDNLVAGTTTISYTIDGTAVEGVDYELVSPNPIVLTADSDPETDYYIYVRLLPDTEQESETKYIQVTLTDVTTEIQSEVVLANDSDILSKTLEIADDFKEVSFEGADEETEIDAPAVVEVTITLSEASTEDVTVDYSITGTGVNDATPTGAGSVTFAAGEVSKTVNLQFTSGAFTADQVVTLQIDGITTADGEVVAGSDVKKFTVKHQ